MSALDRAIIRAYRRPAPRTQKPVAGAPAIASPAATSPLAPRTVKRDSPIFADTKIGTVPVPLSQALADLAKVDVPEKGGAEPVSASIGSLLDEALQPEPSPFSTEHNPPPPEAVSEGHVQPATATAEPAYASTSSPGEQPATIRQSAAIPTSAQLSPPPAQDVTTGSAAGELPPLTQNSGQAAANTWCPLLQVDRVVWPAIQHRLQGTAQRAIAAMTDGLQTIGDSGRKIIGLASCSRGEGVTTLLSAAARNLLGRGRRVAVVDNHWSNPQLARCLGLLPQIGWEEALAGGLPLEEIVIESLADGLAVLPVREPPAGAVTSSAIAASLEILARTFDFVLVDLGPLEEIEDKSTPAHDVAARMDAIVLVQNVRITPPHRLAEVRTRLAASNMKYAGTIQNFVAG